MSIRIINSRLTHNLIGIQSDKDAMVDVIDTDLSRNGVAVNVTGRSLLETLGLPSTVDPNEVMAILKTIATETDCSPEQTVKVLAKSKIAQYIDMGANLATIATPFIAAAAIYLQK
jgi:hypothetical protein